MNFFHVWQVIKYRGPSGVPYPNAYASPDDVARDKKKYLFNCAQRAHANFGEHLPTFLANLLIAGVAFPEMAAAVGVAWYASRLMYATGYVRDKQDDGKGRYNGIWWYVPHLGLLGMAMASAWKVLA